MHRYLLAAFSCLVVALAVFALCVQARNSGAKENRSASTPTQEASAALDAVVKHGLAEGDLRALSQWQSFSRVEPVPGGLPPRSRSAIAELLGGRAPLNTLALEFVSARRTRTPTGITLWMVPGRGVMCLVRQERAAITCSGKRKALRRGLLLQIRRTSPGGNDPSFMTIGIVPDWATGIRLQAGGVPVTLPIQGNAFDFSATRAIRVVALTR